jgi:hypothetical protein
VGVVTTTSTVPEAATEGDTAVMEVLLLTVNEAAGTPPKVTALAPLKLLPVIVTLVPPAVLPLVVPRLVTVGALAAVKVKRAGAESAPGMLTTTSTPPAVLAGVVTLRLLSDTTTKEADTPLNVTSVVFKKPVPVRVSVVPPAVLPEVALSEVMAGAVTAL